MERIAIIAITKNGIKMAKGLKEKFPTWEIFAPEKFSDDDKKINWYNNSTTIKIKELFESNDGLICLFSLGAVVRLISPHLKDKKTDPAVIVIDDQAQFVISTLSGHLGGANQLTNDIAEQLGAIPVITTAADVNKTIAVDLVGKDLGWKIDDDSNVTKISAFMVNAEKIGVYQNCGVKNWWKNKLPENVSTYSNIDELKKSQSKGYLIISDEQINDNEILENAVVYRPPSLVIGIGLHWDTTKDKIIQGLEISLQKFNLSKKSIARFVSIKKEKDVIGLKKVAEEMNIPLEFYDRNDLATIKTPNPSKMVEGYEGTASEAEAAAIKSSGGNLIAEKQKFPPDLTIAIARIQE
ncbi:MAG: cobalamin biosynthesis protein, partial [Candidatus Nitrosopelagicus sp.]|nr:cobalamin biosynthesis protein [Candidatus Nitrosopelagicus sp.]